MHPENQRNVESTNQTMTELFSLLRTPDEEYVEAEKREGNDVISVGDMMIVHGTEHVFSMDRIEKAVRTFEDQQPDLLIVEGTYIDVDPAMTGEEVLATYGEQCYFRWLASQKGIDVQSWDVPWVDRFRDALQKHSVDAMLGWTIAYAAKLLFEKKGGASPSVEEVREMLRLALDTQTIEELQKDFSDVLLDPDTIDIDVIIKKYSGGKGIAELTADIAEDLCTLWHTGETNDVIRDMIVLRDRHAIEVMYQTLRSDKKTFVIGGNDHVITWEKALQKMVEYTGK